MLTNLKSVLSGEKITEHPPYQISELMDDAIWMGQMNALSKEHVVWGIIYEAAQASEKKEVGPAALSRSVPLPNSMITSAEYEPLTVRQVVLASFSVCTKRIYLHALKSYSYVVRIDRSSSEHF